ncbi:hypothetical protein VPH35_109949 [Triticum aestivum]
MLCPRCSSSITVGFSSVSSVIQSVQVLVQAGTGRRQIPAFLFTPCLRDNEAIRHACSFESIYADNFFFLRHLYADNWTSNILPPSLCEPKKRPATGGARVT